MSDSFLSRWARRKQSVRAAALSQPPAAPDMAGTMAGTGEVAGSAPPDEAGLARETAVGAGSEPEAVPDDLLASLPSLDALTPETDLTAFLQAGVPTALRNAALRRMWSLDPAIRDFVSEAREYAYDWNTPGGVPGMGPLLPTDDMKAMLKRVIDGVPAKDRVPGAETPEAEAESHQPSEAPADSDVTEEPEPAVETLARPEEMSLPAAASGLPIADGPDRQLGTEQRSPPRPPMRRHGGAMPS
ncbi:hypothetical protein MPPM_0499 [Methylorubrum populi]|uniref:DUF3306 domain-containing protein n=1 Tax=Methylorubrum populi TaxID=223967 RepID=A0A169QM61_9HYPH|nr:DUF3306 domain-containing protein [Methylorubrum populi]BAU89104.1 hypothetical protein MPPM_0499 [Methylorubrum populi]